MDALERVLRIGREPPSEQWMPDRFGQAAGEGKRRWQHVEAFFEIQYPMFKDAVTVIDESFKLSTTEEQAVKTPDVLRLGRLGPLIAASFVRWERCPATVGFPNPYEPWIEVWEHGGTFGIEHGQFVDVYDSHSQPLGCVVVRRA